MKKGLLIAVVVLLVITSAVFIFQSRSSKEKVPIEQEISNSPNTIEIKDFRFTTKELRIKKGETVTWINKDSARHTVTSDQGNELDSELLGRGESYSHTFNNVGEFSYHCTPHPYMKGKIIVE